MQVDPVLAGYTEAQGAAHLALMERLRAVPGVEAVSIGSRPPFTSIGDSRDVVPARRHTRPAIGYSRRRVQRHRPRLCPHARTADAARP